MVRKADELITFKEKAFVVFTRGKYFERDGSGNGQTGNWVAGAKSLAEIDKVIIYWKDELVGRNKVYIANYRDWFESPEEGRKVLRFSGLQEKGSTSSNWFEFGGNAWSPTFYIR